MPRYVILASHSPDTCPAANARVRARAEEGMGRLLPKLAQEAGVAIELPTLHLDPSHRTVTVVDAPAIETVTRLIWESGLMQWNTVEVVPTTPVAELMAELPNARLGPIWE